jgi:AcrR family transcriptional regulator
VSPKTTYHHGDLRSALIETGLRVLQQEGLNALSLRRVAREAEVSAMAPYRHFKDKQSLLAAISEKGFVELHELLEQANQDHPGDLDASGQAYLSFALKEPETYRLMFTQKVLCEGEDNETLEEAGSSAFESLVKTIEVGIESGKIKETTSLDLALTAWSLVHGISMLLIDGILENNPYKELTPEQVLSLCQNYFKNGWRS